jgi:hypothetical protein
LQAFLSREPLDGVPEHGARHGWGMFSQEAAQRIGVALAGLAQHPTSGLVHEVVLVVEKRGRQPEGPRQIAGTDEREGGDHRDSAVPELRGRDELIEQ